MKNLSLKEQFIELRAKGHSYSSIAKELKKSKQTIINWNKELHIEVSNFRQLNTEALREKLKLGINKRLHTYAKVLDKAAQELEKRDFSDISSDKLISIVERINDKVAEMEPINFTEEISLEESVFAPKYKTWVG